MNYEFIEEATKKIRKWCKHHNIDANNIDLISYGCDKYEENALFIVEGFKGNFYIRKNYSMNTLFAEIKVVFS